MEEVVKATGGESGTQRRHAGRQLRLPLDGAAQPGRRPSVEDLAVGINAVSSSIETAGYGERLLCAVFAFADAGQAARPAGLLHLQLQARLLVPVRARPGSGGGSQASERSTERELQLKAQMGDELPIEPELERWFPLWGIPI